MIVRETSRDAGLAISTDTLTLTRSFLVQTDSPATSPEEVQAATGLQIGQEISASAPGGRAVTLEVVKLRVRATDGVGMLWTVTADYEFVPGDDPEEPGLIPGVPGKQDIWSGSSSVTKKARYVDRSGDVMTNSAGDPFEEGCLADTAEDRLTLTTYRMSHTDWIGESKLYTNTVNSGNWNGGEEGTWKCQGCSKKLNMEQHEAGLLIYWEITWEFAYDPDGWTWKPWDIGFSETTNEDGEPTSYGTGEAAPGRRTIKGKDGKGVRNPVALNGGVAKAPGLPPDALEFNLYILRDFGAAFGEVFTPRG